MADTFGAMALPIDPPTGPSDNPDNSVSDPLVDTTLAFFRAVLNAEGNQAWQAVAPGPRLVENVGTSNPEELVFNTKDLPCLYMWRAGGDGPEWLAEDYLISRDKLRCCWVFPRARQAFQAFRSQILNGITKALNKAVHLNRHPAWIAPGDTDPQASTHGSVFSGQAGWIEMYLGKWNSKAIAEPVSNEPTGYYAALQMEIDVVELYRQDPNTYPLLTTGNTSVKTPDGLLIAEHDFT